MLILLDNYDSFTYNLVQQLGQIDRSLQVQVFRNDKITIEEIESLKPSHVMISPGPCTPREGGISNEIIREFAARIPILGVCLGHQCIGVVHGARLVRARRIMHGKTDRIHHDGKTIFDGVTNPFVVARYHSLILERNSLPDEFEVTSWTDEEEIMGVRHKIWPLEGVQFHPESFMTEQGDRLIRNFLRR